MCFRGTKTVNGHILWYVFQGYKDSELSCIIVCVLGEQVSERSCIIVCVLGVQR